MTPVEEKAHTSRSNAPTPWKAYVELLKLRLSSLVALSGALGYMMGDAKPYDVTGILLFSLSGMMITGAANATNQVLEVEFDRLMQRTGQRPLPSGRLNKRNAQYFIAVLLFIGLFIQTVLFNPLTAAFSFVSFILYGFVYTPLKRVGSIAVYVGAIPGGLPPLIGWVAATGVLSVEAVVLFLIQFIWQFTHFWAVAWVLDDDYQKAGFKLLPLKRPKTFRTALVVLFFTVALLPLGVLPTQLGLTGSVSAWVATLCGLLVLWYNIMLVKEVDNRSAKRLMFSAFIYLPVVQIAYVLDKV